VWEDRLKFKNFRSFRKLFWSASNASSKNIWLHAVVTGNIFAFHNANKHFIFTAIYEFPTVLKIHVFSYIITSGHGDIPRKTWSSWLFLSNSSSVTWVQSLFVVFHCTYFGCLTSFNTCITLRMTEGTSFQVDKILTRTPLEIFTVVTSQL